MKRTEARRDCPACKRISSMRIVFLDMRHREVKPHEAYRSAWKCDGCHAIKAHE